MKLYFSPGACSLASHIVLCEIGRPFETEQVNIRAKETATGGDFRSINPKGAVPVLDTGEGVLTEGAAILQFVADSAGRTDLTGGAPGTMARARVQEMLNYISAELHKSYSPLFRPDLSEDHKAAQFDIIRSKLAWPESRLAGGQPYLAGDAFTVADAYAFVITGWSPMVGFDLSAFPNLLAWRERVAVRPAVVAAMRAEGLLQAA